MEFLRPDSNSTFILQTSLRPVIGVTQGSNDKDVHCLINEGFVVEPESEPGQCAFVLDSSSSLNSRQLLETVNQARGPLLRFWRWPDQYKSALAITADVDAITIWDFVRRAHHFYKTKSR